MADSHPKQEQPAGSASARGYALPNQASPLPRQWQLPTPQSPPSPQSRAPSGIQHFYQGPAGAGDWRQAAPPRRMERAILLGLWLLVMLAAIATGLSMLDRSAMTPTPTPTPAARPLTSDDAEAMRRAALAAAAGERDPFDEPLPAQPVPAASEPAARPVTRLAAAPKLSLEEPVAAPAPPAAAIAPAASTASAAPAASTPPPSPAPACADALRAMQLCPGMR